MSTDAVTDPTKKSFWRLRNFLLMLTPLLVPVIGWMGSQVSGVWTEYQALVSKVTTLEVDRSKWASLAELHDKQVQLERAVAVNEADIRWVRWFIQERESANPNKKLVDSLEVPVKPLDRELPVTPKPKPTEPVPPKIDPDQYRKMQQHRYPNEQFKK